MSRLHWIFLIRFLLFLQNQVQIFWSFCCYDAKRLSKNIIALRKKKSNVIHSPRKYSLRISEIHLTSLIHQRIFHKTKTYYLFVLGDQVKISCNNIFTWNIITYLTNDQCICGDTQVEHETEIPFWWRHLSTWVHWVHCQFSFNFLIRLDLLCVNSDRIPLQRRTANVHLIFFFFYWFEQQLCNIPLKEHTRTQYVQLHIYSLIHSNLVNCYCSFFYRFFFASQQ